MWGEVIKTQLKIKHSLIIIYLIEICIMIGNMSDIWNIVLEHFAEDKKSLFFPWEKKKKYVCVLFCFFP